LHIIKKKVGRFDPTKFDDRYDAALLELVKAKIEGRTITPPKTPEPTEPADLMQALRESAAAAGRPSTRRKATAKASKRAGKSASKKKRAASKSARRRKAA